MPPATLADWTTPRPFALPDLGPGLEGERLEALAQALQTIAADPTVQALVLFGSRATGNARPDSDVDLLVVERTPHLEGTRWYVINEAARHGQALVVRST
ncbi:MAG: nucleotidyltransferase family protein [Cyanobacteriota bacterium]|jgi:hypothetical protein